MFKILILLSLISNASPRDLKVLVANHSPPVKAAVFRSYREWKVDQVAYWHFKGQADMAKDLTVADYFAGYLTKQRDQSLAIKEVSGRLSPDEVAELMTIYANSVFGSHSSAVPGFSDKEAAQQP